jgi:pimeloyl-ACP methyl ester carboxylesterase
MRGEGEGPPLILLHGSGEDHHIFDKLSLKLENHFTLYLVNSRNHGEAVDKMALLGVNLKPGDFTEESHKFIKDSYEETKDPLFKLMLEEPDIELDAVRGVGIPVLVVAAENDIFKPKTFTDLAGALPGATLKIMEGHEHDSYIVGQDLLYPDLLRFFK